MQTSDNPLVEAIRASATSMLGRMSSTTPAWPGWWRLFSMIYADSRQLFALSRAGYLPKVLSLTSGRKTPWAGADRPGTIGFVLAATPRHGRMLLNMAVFGATTMRYVLLMTSAHRPAPPRAGAASGRTAPRAAW